MNKRHIITTIIIAGLLTMILFALNIYSKEKSRTNEWATQPLEEETYDGNDETEDEFAEVLIDLPDSLNSIVEGYSWSGELFCTAGGKDYYFAENLFSYALCTSDEVLVENPSIDYVNLDTIQQTFIISVGEKSIIVDFADSQSVKQLSALRFKLMPGFKCQRWSNIANFNDRVSCPLEIDYPISSVANNHYIHRWIATVALASITGPTRIPVSSPSIFTNTWKNRIGYKGNLEDADAINKCISGNYFKNIKKEWGTDEENYPPALFSSLSLRARYYTDRYVTYQMADRGYGGGAHGWSTVELVSYDHINHQEVGWTYLFKPGCENQVLELFEKVAETNEQYKHWNASLWAGVMLTDQDGNQTGEMLLPQPALTPDGVCISFQPYSIACHAAGSFHFTVPYDKLKPYLTDRGKWCIGLK